MSSQTAPAPTIRQLSYLRTLASNTATTFAYPSTRREASRQIEELRRLTPVPRTGPEESEDDTLAEQLQYATAVHDHEVSGFGSSASWSTRPLGIAQRHAGARRELARYALSTSERVLYGERSGGEIMLTDAPAWGDGRTYLIERALELEDHGALDALIADYLAQARELDEVPMASAAVAQLVGCGGIDA